MRCHVSPKLSLKLPASSCSISPVTACRPRRHLQPSYSLHAAANQHQLCTAAHGQHSRRSSVLVQAVGTGGGMAPQLKSAIDQLIQSNKVVVFMKGTKEFPQCGFSNTVVQILRSLDAPFESVNILENEMLRSGMKEYSQWPTFPQVYVDGEFFGGCDIMIEAYQSGELQETLERVQNE